MARGAAANCRPLYCIWLTRRPQAYILPLSLAVKNVDEVHDGDIKRLIAELQAKELGARSINIVMARLRMIFSTAKIRRL